LYIRELSGSFKLKSCLGYEGDGNKQVRMNSHVVGIQKKQGTKSNVKNIFLNTAINKDEGLFELEFDQPRTLRGFRLLGAL